MSLPFQSIWYQSHPKSDASPFNPPMRSLAAMASGSFDTKFAFVNSSDSAVPKDPGIRLLIRKQAMKKAGAARRSRRNYGKNNLRQFPIYHYSVPFSDPAADSPPKGDPGTECANDIQPFEPPSLLGPDWVMPHPKARSGQLDLAYNIQNCPDQVRQQPVVDWVSTPAESFQHSPSNNFDKVCEILQEEEAQVRNLQACSDIDK